MQKLSVVVGGQFGSEGKGAVAAHLHRQERYAWAVRVAGPNAGHTVVQQPPVGYPNDAGRRWPLRQVPVAAVADPDCGLYIGPGSEVDLNVLAGEVRDLENAGIKVKHRLFVSPQATVLMPHHEARENRLGVPFGGGNFGSTRKGIGAARADRALRVAQLYGDLPKSQLPISLHAVTCGDIGLSSTASGDGPVLIEGTQGYGLGLHAGYYPYCTSSDARAVDFCAMAGVSPWSWDVEVWVCLRPYPIRIAGNSGPLRDETTWEALGLPTELTTVTQKPRRVGGWDPVLAHHAVAANGRERVKIAFTMADQVVPALAGDQGRANRADPLYNDLMVWVDRIETDTLSRVRLVGTGPSSMLDLA
jgi:adenylosuccinate synthase